MFEFIDIKYYYEGRPVNAKRLDTRNNKLLNLVSHDSFYSLLLKFKIVNTLAKCAVGMGVGRGRPWPLDFKFDLFLLTF